MNATRDFVNALEDPGWAEHEFEAAPFADRRLNQRAATMASDFARHPGAPIPKACERDAKRTGAYRFLENDDVLPEEILAGHCQARLARLAQEPVVLAPSDTTSFNYSHLPGTTGLGAIGNNDQPTLRGLWLHSTHAFTPAGLPLGLIAASIWARPQATEPKLDPHRIPFEEKESVCWRQSWQACQAARAQMPESALWVNITDMEGDIYEVFAEVLAHPKEQRVEALIRGWHNRQLEGEGQRLWDYVAARPLAGTLEVRVPRHKDQRARIATLQIRFSPVTVKAPCHKADQPSLALWAIEARELNASQGAEPILWRLVTTLPVTTAQEAIQMVHWYAVRWRIEVFHKIVKSVCRAESHQEETAQRLERMLMFDLVVAWRIQVLTEVGRQSPDLPASDYFAESEWKALYAYINHTPQVPAQAPGLGQMMHWIGRLGGFVKCKSNPHPGPITLARGLELLNVMSALWAVQNMSCENAGAHAKKL
jgi:hypothetical protein